MSGGCHQSPEALSMPSQVRQQCFTDNTKSILLDGIRIVYGQDAQSAA